MAGGIAGAASARRGGTSGGCAYSRCAAQRQHDQHQAGAERAAARFILPPLGGVRTVWPIRRALFLIARVALVMLMRRSRHGVDVVADLERIANVLALELRGELRRVDARNSRTARDGRRR